VILSSGLTGLEQIRQSARFLEDQWACRGIASSLAVLHCVSSYPAPDREANLAAIPLLARELGCVVGYSDHTLGTDACVAAVALGARIIEKHFTLDTQYSDFRDHQLSADPAEMRRLVGHVRRVSVMLGKAEKVVQPSEAAGGHLSRRSIVASADLKRDHRLERQDLTWIRPGIGLPPGDEHRLLGKTLNRDVVFGEPILPGDVE
jgi:N,N'-diacetyllegionaminate synthase